MSSNQLPPTREGRDLPLYNGAVWPELLLPFDFRGASVVEDTMHVCIRYNVCRNDSVEEEEATITARLPT